MTKNYVSVDQGELKTYVEARLKIFYEEQLNVPIVVFDEVLEHILRIDRVLGNHSAICYWLELQVLVRLPFQGLYHGLTILVCSKLRQEETIH